MTAINEDRDLLTCFLRELIKVKPPTKADALKVLEQQYPDEIELSEEESERRGVPDGWVFDEDGWCVFIESKVLAKFDIEQIRYHRRTAERRGFKSIIAVAITPRHEKYLPADTIHLEWRTIYAWLQRYRSRSVWASKAADYFEIAEAKLIETEQFVEGTLTMFSGVPFSRERPFTYLEGKRVLALAMDELRKRNDLRVQIGINPAALGRPAITGQKADSVWNYLSLANGGGEDVFTKFPHLTLGINVNSVEVTVTVPNAVNNEVRRKLIALKEEGFRSLVAEILNNFAPLLRDHPGALPWFRGVQRRYPSQRAKPFIDARIEFDLRTAIPSSGPPKTQLRWLSAAYDAFINKEGSNYQIQVGIIFPFETCPGLNQPEAIDLIAAAWIGCKPLVKLAGGSSQ